jgi:hypothetical protein
MVCCAYASISLGFVLGPPPVFVVLAVVALLVEGVALVCLWHHDTLVHVRGPWIGGPGAAETPAGALGQSMEESGPPEPGPASPPSR